MISLVEKSLLLCPTRRWELRSYQDINVHHSINLPIANIHINRKMTSPAGTYTRGMSKSRLSSYAESNSSPTATQNMAQESPITKISEKQSRDITPVNRQTSLIPAYRYDDTIDDLELENLLGTPYTCEMAQAKKRMAKKKRNKINRAAKKVLQLQEEEEGDFFTPTSTAASPPLPTAAEKQNALSVEKDDDSSEITASMEAMSLGKPSSPTDDTNVTSNKIDNSQEDSSGLLGGITGSHIRFSPRNKMYLRGVPQPTGTHTTFEEE